MRVAYKALFGSLGCTFFSEVASAGIFELEPTSATRQLLKGAGLVFRPEPSGGRFTVRSSR